jgi:hypothetical protein
VFVIAKKPNVEAPPEHTANISEANPEPAFAFLLKYSCTKLCKDNKLSLENSSQSPKLLCSTDLLHTVVLWQTQGKHWGRNSVCEADTMITSQHRFIF